MEKVRIELIGVVIVNLDSCVVNVTNEDSTSPKNFPTNKCSTH